MSQSFAINEHVEPDRRFAPAFIQAATEARFERGEMIRGVRFYDRPAGPLMPLGWRQGIANMTIAKYDGGRS